MMRHILYLVTRLQHDSANYDWNLNDGCEGDEDDPSEFDDEDENEGVGTLYGSNAFMFNGVDDFEFFRQTAPHQASRMRRLSFQIHWIDRFACFEMLVSTLSLLIVGDSKVEVVVWLMTHHHEPGISECKGLREGSKRRAQTV
jgi:hypothetical protein